MEFAMNRLEGKFAMVVYVASPLGRACALRFAAEGATVMVADPSAEVAKDVASQIESGGGSAVPIQFPLGDEAAIDELARRAAEVNDSLDVLMVAAGVLDWWTETEDTWENWERLLRLDLLMPVFLAKALRPLLARSGAGSIIFYGSVDGVWGNPRIPAYSAARGALTPYTHLIAHTYGPDGIRVNTIAGAGISPAGPEVPPPLRPTVDWDDLPGTIPLGRISDPEDFAGVAAFLASSDASYVTGSVMIVDGGRTSVTPSTGILRPPR
jgi:meso-butanediol dehydrogenase/(S,S)-butanediol dehydrogenase/diacetyl reductase